MRGWISLFLFYLIGLAQHALGAPAERTILVVGDSLSAGYGLRQDEAWPALLALRLSERGYAYKVANASISGDTTANGLTRLPASLDASRAAIVVIALGANDGLRGQAPSAMQANLKAMVETARTRGAQVLLVGMRLPPNLGAAYNRRFEQAYAEVARQMQVPLVPFLLEGFASDRSRFQDDGIHPVAAAQPLILDTVWPQLVPLLIRQARR